MQRKEMISAIISHKDNLRADELKHHGILGQKWGVRRYQNTDGSYTTEGRERYGIGLRASDHNKMKKYIKADAYTVEKEIRKQIRKKRRDQGVDFLSAFNSSIPIGENSKKILEELEQKRREYNNDPAYKSMMNELTLLDNKAEREEILPDEYDRKRDKIYEKYKEIASKSEDLGLYRVSSAKKGMVVSNEFANGYGKKLTVAFAKDLGYTDEEADYIAKKLADDNRALN